MAEKYNDGPLAGYVSASVLIDPEHLFYLEHASKETGYSIERLAQISVDEAALNHSRTHQLYWSKS